MIKLMLGDCLEVMGEIPAGSVDLVLADLPYGTTACKWDVVIPLGRLWSHYQRVLAPRGAVVLMASQPFTSTLVVSNSAWFKYEWIWHKTQSRGHLNARIQPLAGHESILVFGPGRVTYNPQLQPKSPKDVRPITPRGKQAGCYGGYQAVSERTIPAGMSYPTTVLKLANPNRGEHGLHPTQKPVALMEYLVRTYSNEGETVLDNTMGSGTTGEACLNTGRSFIGIESYEPYFRIAESRLLP